jgi:hypothetical protein
MTKYPVGRRRQQKEQKEHCKRKLLSMIGALEVPQEGQGALPNSTPNSAACDAYLLTSARPPSRSEKQTIVQLRDSDCPTRVSAQSAVTPNAISPKRRKKAGPFLGDRISATAAARKHPSGTSRAA